VVFWTSSDRIPGPNPDSPDYAYAAQSLLQGHYLVSWQGFERLPYYTPGLSLLLVPSVALGGVRAAVWTSYVAALVVGGVVAALAHRVGPPLAAPLAILATLFTPAAHLFASIVMTEMPAAALLGLEAALLVTGRARWQLLAAGALGAVLTWMRPASCVFLLAGVAGLTASSSGWSARMRFYLVGAVPILVLLGIWLWATFGSPLSTPYAALRGGSDPGAPDNLFALSYASTPATSADGAELGGAGVQWHLPNDILYPLQLIGADGFLLRPGIGLLGVMGLLLLARSPLPAAATLGRFGLGVVILTLAVYVPYYYQSGRFLVGAAVFVGLGAGVMLARAIGIATEWVAGLVAAAGTRSRSTWSGGCSIATRDGSCQYAPQPSLDPAAGVRVPPPLPRTRQGRPSELLED
jgi:hypothetical protein